jgi:hypothetical protein
VQLESVDRRYDMKGFRAENVSSSGVNSRWVSRVNVLWGGGREHFGGGASVYNTWPHGRQMRKGQERQEQKYGSRDCSYNKPTWVQTSKGRMKSFCVA